MGDRKIIEMEEGWADLEKIIQRLHRLLEGEPEEHFTAVDFMQFNKTVYNMCTQKPPHDYSGELYGKYRDSFITYLNDKVLPSLHQLRDEALLKALSRHWNNHKLMLRWLSRFFNYLDRYYVLRNSLHPLTDLGHLCFKDLVYVDFAKRAKGEVLRLVERERADELIDCALVKDIVEMFATLANFEEGGYERHFENDLLTQAVSHYQCKASEWIEQDSCPNYILKVEGCLRLEVERADAYLTASTKGKLLDTVRTELLSKYRHQLLTDADWGFGALLKNDKTEELARVYLQFKCTRDGHDMMNKILRELFGSQVTMLVQEVTKAGPSRGTGPASGAVQQLLSSVTELYDKYMQYISTCFENDRLFQESLLETIEVEAQPLLTDEHWGLAALLTDGKFEELTRVHRLFKPTPNGLRLMVKIFKDHVSSQGATLVQEVTAAAELAQEEAGPSRGTGPASGAVQQLVSSVTELHNKYMQYITICFDDCEFFHHSLEEAIEMGTELLSKYGHRLMTDEDWGFLALLKDDKSEELARMYHLLKRNLDRRNEMAETFKEHIESEGTMLVQEMPEGVKKRKASKRIKTGPSRGTGPSSGAEQQLVGAVAELHDKYMQYVSTCFGRCSLFRQSLLEACKAIVNKRVAVGTYRKLVASLRDKPYT